MAGTAAHVGSIRAQRAVGRVVGIAAVIAILLFTLYPFYSMLITSLKPVSELFDRSVSPFWVFHPTVKNYTDLLTQTSFVRWFGNSLLVAVVSTTISLTVSTLAAYALSRIRFPGADFMGSAIFAVYLVPPSLLFLPLASVVSRLTLNNSLWSLILTYPTFQIPFATWLLIGYFRNIPEEIEDSARVDGASRLTILRRIVVPMAFPGLVTVTLFAFTLAWGELIYALTFISQSSRQTVSLGTVTQLIRGDAFFWGQLMAAGLMAAIPITVAYAFLSDYYVEGLTAGSIK